MRHTEDITVPCKRDRIKFFLNIELFTKFSFNNKFNKIQLLKFIFSGQSHKKDGFCEGMENFLSSTTLIIIYNWVEHNTECKKENLYNMEERS